MSSQLITPPDQIDSGDAYLIINAVDEEIECLILWLKTVVDNYDIHLYNTNMPDTEWACSLASKVKHILVNDKYTDLLDARLHRILDMRPESVFFIGNNQKFKAPVEYFILNRN